MPAQKPFTVDLKVELLDFLLELADDWENGDDPDIRNFWHSVQREFKGAKGTTWQGKNFEIRMENEEEAWLEECENPDMKRRRGHEEGSQYDNLMKKFSAKWNDLLKPHWQFMVDSGFEELELVPDWVRPFVKAPSKPIKARANAAPTTNAIALSSRTPLVATEPKGILVDGKPLKEIVDFAIEKALSTGNHAVADDVRDVYNESLQNPALMQLLKDLLTLPTCKERNKEFSGYVKELKKRKADQRQAEEQARQQAQSGKVKQATQAATHMAIPHVQPNWASRPGARPSNFAPPSVNSTTAKMPAQASAPLIIQTANAPVPVAGEKSSTTAKPGPSLSSKVSPASKAKSSSKAASPTRSKPKSNACKKYVHTSPPADVYNPQRYRILGDLLYAPVVHEILRKAPCRSNAELEILKKILTEDPKTTTDLVALAKRLQAELQQYDNVQSSTNVKDDQARPGAVRDDSNNINLSKRRRESQSPLDAAEEEDLLEAQRAAKRRKSDGNDRDLEWNPTRRSRRKAQRNKRKESNSANDEESLSNMSDGELEMHKSAYVEEIVRKRKEEDARKEIEERYGPVSPTDAGEGQEIADWASMASPTLTPADLGQEDGDGAPTCPTTRSRARNRSIPPPPESADASNQALQLISAAAADAVARDPAIGRLEAKLDSLLKGVSSHGMPTLNTACVGSKLGRAATELAASCDQTLASIASMLRNSDLESQNPELSVAILQLTQNATKSADLAAQAASHAAKMAQDVGVVLQLLASKTPAEDQPATPLSSKDEI